MVVDDNPANLKFVIQFLEQEGYAVRSAANGKDALRLFTEQSPDVVLMDIMLPDIDGREVTSRIKNQCGDRWVPVIYMTALAAEADEIRGFDAGGDEYLTKPINLEVLRARINAMRRIADVHRRLAETTRELQRYRIRAEQEERIAEELMQRLTHEDRLHDRLLQTWHLPATRFSGDLIAATRAPGDRLYLMMADSTGHGLAAALPLLQLAQIFYTMAERGFSLPTMVTEMNNKTLARMPCDRFVAATFAIIDEQNQVFEIWNGGNPAPVFLNESGDVLREFQSRHMPLGIETPEEFNSRTDVYHWPTTGELIMFTDGVIEAQNIDKEPYGEIKTMETLRQSAFGNRFPALVAELKRHIGATGAHDDISLVAVRCTALE